MDKIVASRLLASDKVEDDTRTSKSKSTKRAKKQSKKEKAREKKSKKKRKRRHSSSSSSDSSDSSSDSSSSSSSSSSSEDEKAKKRRRKIKKEKAKMKKKAKSIAKKKKKLADEALAVPTTPVVPAVIPEADVGPNISLSSSKIRAPMTKEEYEKQQSTLKWIVDPETGRRRLIRGSGEIVEELVSKERHEAINKAATSADGQFFMNQSMAMAKSSYY